MDSLRQALIKLRTEIDKGATRRKEAEAHGKTLLTTLKDKDAELEALRERLDLSRHILTLTLKCEEIRRAIRDNNDKYVSDLSGV
ncbi:hypothetical protein DXG01_012350 [Tephrocybe rancida]|nr:hypothetical protein DXG01_012350 [Tephrocybe rancida]